MTALSPMTAQVRQGVLVASGQNKEQEVFQVIVLSVVPSDERPGMLCVTGRAWVREVGNIFYTKSLTIL